MGCDNSKVLHVEEKISPLPKHVHFSEPEYVFLMTPRDEKPPIDNGVQTELVQTPRNIRTPPTRAWPLHVRTPPKIQPPPPSPQMKRRARRISLHEQDIELPPPQPPRAKRKEFIPDEKMFLEIDNYALHAPKTAEGSVETLAKYLSATAKNDLEKVRSFFRWITNNITYDTDSYFRGKKKPSDASSVLRLKTAESLGYCNLLDGLCRCVKIPVKCIHGFAKGFDYNPYEDYSETDSTNHTWTAVHIDGDWRFVECAWSAGHLDSRRKFNWSFKDFFFMTDPEDLVWSHFPVFNQSAADSSPWQLLENPIKLERFNKIIRPIFRAFEWRVDFVSHKIAVLEVWKKVDVTIGSSKEFPLTIVTSQVYQDQFEIRQFSMVKRLEHDKYQITFRPPAKGKFVLKILGNVDGEENETFALIEYHVRCHEAVQNIQPYPDLFGPWGPVPGYLEYGFPKNTIIDPTLIAEDGEITFSIDTNKHIEAVTRLIYAFGNIPEIDDYAMMESTGNALHIRARFPRGGFYKLRISCKNGAGDYKHAINYLVECKTGLEPCDPFPKVYKSAREFKCRLLEPLYLDLLRSSQVVVRFTSDTVRSVTLMGKKFEKTNNNEWHLQVQPTGAKFLISGSESGAVGTFKGLYEFRLI